MLVKIVSGGQTCADKAGWRAARAFGIPTGGWMSLGFLTEDGVELYYGPCAAPKCRVVGWLAANGGAKRSGCAESVTLASSGPALAGAAPRVAASRMSPVRACTSPTMRAILSWFARAEK
jgi:hypothetical protein